MRKFPLFRVVELLEPGVDIAQIIHEAGDLFGSRQTDLLRMPAFDRRFRNAGQILRQNHVRTAPEHLGELHDVREFTEPRDHFEASGGIQFHRRFALGKSRSETVESIHMKRRQTLRRYVANHVEQLRKLVRDRRSSCRVDIPAARFFADLIQLQCEAERLLRSGVVQPLYPRHFRDEEVPFVAVNFVHEDAVHAQLVEIDDIFRGMAILQFIQTVFEAAFALLRRFHLASRKSHARRVLRLGKRIKFLLIFRPHEVGIVLNHIERTLSDDDDIPFARGNAPEKPFALLLDQIIFRRDQDVGGRVELRGEFRKLLKRGVLNDNHRLRRKFEADQFHRGGNHHGCFPGSDRVRQQAVPLNAPRDRPLLMFAQNERLAVDYRTRPRINVERRQVVLLQHIVVEAFVIDLFHLQRKLTVIHHEVVETVLDFILILTRRQSRFFIYDIDIRFAIRIPDRFLDDRIFQIQDELNQLHRVEGVEIVLIQEPAAPVIGINLPAVGIFIIMNLNFAVQVFGDPFLNEFRRQPERTEREVDIFNGQRFRQNRFQRLHIGGQTMRLRFLDLHLDVP